MRKTLNLLFDGAAYLAALFVLAIFVVMIGSSFLREIGVGTSGTDDLVAWFCAAASFLAMAHTFRYGDFVRVTLLLERLSSRVRRWAEAACLSIGAVFTGYLTWWAVRYVYEGWQFQQMADGLIAIPIWIPQLSFVAGAALLFVAVLEQLFVVLSGAKPDYVTAIEERHARGDFSEEI
jgi:TRAP-type C4-dicarboxylate transport system permease small subunit